MQLGPEPEKRKVSILWANLRRVWNADQVVDARGIVTLGGPHDRRTTKHADVSASLRSDLEEIAIKRDEITSKKAVRNRLRIVDAVDVSTDAVETATEEVHLRVITTTIKLESIYQIVEPAVCESKALLMASAPNPEAVGRRPRSSELDVTPRHKLEPRRGSVVVKPSGLA